MSPNNSMPSQFVGCSGEIHPCVAADDAVDRMVELATAVLAAAVLAAVVLAAAVLAAEELLDTTRPPAKTYGAQVFP